jgi:hypothetical protein
MPQFCLLGRSLHRIDLAPAPDEFCEAAPG